MKVEELKIGHIYVNPNYEENKRDLRTRGYYYKYLYVGENAFLDIYNDCITDNESRLAEEEISDLIPTNEDLVSMLQTQLNGIDMACYCIYGEGSIDEEYEALRSKMKELDKRFNKQ